MYLYQHLSPALLCTFSLLLASVPLIAFPWSSRGSASSSHVPSAFGDKPTPSAPIPGAHVQVRLSLVSTFGRVCTRTGSFVHYSAANFWKSLLALSANSLYLCRPATYPAFALDFLTEAPGSSSMHDFIVWS